jgi:DHA1 family bicyclomycin/chloramphenicol resistance-like MFS transporter
MSLGSERLTTFSIWGVLLIASVLLVIAFFNQGVPPLWVFMTLGFGLFFCIGVSFGNVNSLAMLPLGKMAGIGAAVVGSVSNLVGVLMSACVGWFFTDTLTPIISGLIVASIISVVLLNIARGRDDSLIE